MLTLVDQKTWRTIIFGAKKINFFNDTSCTILPSFSELYVYFIHMILFRIIYIYTYRTYKTLLSLNRLLTHLRCGLWPSLYTSNTTPKTPTSENAPFNALNIHRCHLLLCCVENPQPPNIYNLPPIWGIGYVRVAEAAKGNTFSSTMYTYTYIHT